MSLRIILIVTCFHVYLSSQSQVDKITVGDTLFNVTGTTETGDTISLVDFKGKFVLLNFTNTFCEPCWGTYKQMDEAQAKYGDNLKVISFHTDDEKSKWDKIAKYKDITFNSTVIWYASNKEKISEIYQVDGWPYYFLINKNGVIVAKWFGARSGRLKRNLRRFVK